MAANLLPGGGCCNPFSCLLNFVCTCICQIVCTILLFFALLLFILWLIFRPRSLEFTVTGASLAQFDLNQNTLRYDLVVNLTIGNPNDRIVVRYDEIVAAALYQGHRFSTLELEPFDQDRNENDTRTARFSGQNVVVLGEDEISSYNIEKSSGEFGIDVRLQMLVRLKFLFLETSSVMKPKIDCPIHVPLTADGATAAPFLPHNCGFIW